MMNDYFYGLTTIILRYMNQADCNPIMFIKHLENEENT